MILLSHPIGNENVRQSALALAEAHLLAEYWTGVSWNPQSPVARLLPQKLRSQLARRTLPPLVRELAHHAPFREACRLILGRWDIPWLTAYEKGPLSVDGVFRNFDRQVARRVAKSDGLTAVYAPEDGAEATFSAAAQRGLARIYDLPIGYWRAARAVYQEEAEREPEWAATMQGLRDSPEKLARKDRELELAQTVTVASSFTKSTLALAAPGNRQVCVVPYGAPPPCDELSPAPASHKLRVMFAGSLGQRKGLSYLLGAISALGNGVELTLLGRKTTEKCAALNAALARHRWIPSLLHAGVLAEMRAHDVLVFPSLFEGFGLVITEAMSQGIPVITTVNTAGPDLITDGVDGFIVPIRSTEAISEKLDLLARDSKLLSELKFAARRTAAKHSWQTFRSRLAEQLLRSAPIHPAPNSPDQPPR